MLGALSLVPAAGAAAAPVRTAALQQPQVSVQISTITPLSPGPKDTLRITGRVVNTQGPHLSQVQVSLHLGLRAVASRTELHDLRAQPVPQDLATDQQLLADGNLAVGHSLPFTISVPIKKLQLPGPGVYPMQVTAIGLPDGDARLVDLATTSTFLPYIPTAEATPATPVAWLVPLTGAPTVLADGTFTADGSKEGTPIVAAASPGGRLRNLLDGMAGARAVTATLDSSVVQALAIASGSYLVSQAPGAPPKRYPASAAAKQWLADLRAAGQVSLIGLPYANPDVQAVLHDRQPGLLADAQSQGSDVLSIGLAHAADRLVPDIVVPPAGAVDAAGVRYYQSTLKADALVLPAGALPASGDNPSASASVPGVSSRVLLIDDVLSQLATKGPGRSPRLAEQDIVAELAEAHLEDRFAAVPNQAGGTRAARPLLIAPPAGWNPPVSWLQTLLHDTSHLPWVNQVSVADLLKSPAEPRAGLVYPPAARSAEIPPSVIDESARIQSLTGGLFATSLPPNTPQPRSPASIVRPIRNAALSALSSYLRDSPDVSAAFTASAQNALQDLQRRVRVVASPQVTLTSKSGRVPVTIENDLDAAVDVSLVLTSLDKSRVSQDTVVRRTVRAGQKVQVEVEVKAASAGTFPVRLALYTPSGQPLGSPAQVLVRSTTFGVVATVFTIVALAVLGLAVLIRAVRALARRTRRRSEPPAEQPKALSP